MGTGGALKNIKNKISKKFLLVNGDTFFKINYNLILNYNLGNKSGLMLLTNSKENSLTNKLNNLSLKNGKVKFSKRSKMINSGVYLFKHKIIEKINSYKGKQISLENDVLKFDNEWKNMWFKKRVILLILVQGETIQKQKNIFSKNYYFIFFIFSWITVIHIIGPFFSISF